MASSSTLADRRAMIPRAKRGEIFTAEEVEMMKNDPLGGGRIEQKYSYELYYYDSRQSAYRTLIV